MRKGLVALLVMVFLLLACRGTVVEDIPTSSDLYIVVGNSASSFTGNGNGDGLLLDTFSKENNVKIFVQVANDREMRDFRDGMMAGNEGSPDILIVDDSLDADGLQNVKLIASHKVGVAVRSDIADQLALQGNTLGYAEFVSLMKSGDLSVVASNALAGSASREFFFSAMAWCANMDAANLTADIVKMDTVQACGKDIYDYIKSTNGANVALEQVYNAVISGDTAGSNTVIAFDSDLLGEGGLNAKMIAADKPVFRFFYFREATAKANVAIGSRDLKDSGKQEAANKLVETMISDAAQEAINLAGFSEGSAALVRHNDTAFKPEWGVSSNPPVQIVNAPISSVAGNAMKIYRDYYKRVKIVKACVDLSPSMYDNRMSVDVNGVTYELSRTQTLLRALLKITDSNWLNKYELTPGQKDIFEYYFFSTMNSGLVTSSVGANTQPAHDRFDYLLGPWDEQDPRNWNRSMVEQTLFFELGFSSNGTEMFDCASLRLDEIAANFDPNIDYFIVILTDGENMDSGMNAEQFYEKWLAFHGNSNVSLIGIAFGTDGKSINEEYTAKFRGSTEKGNDDKGLVEAFKKIFGN